MARCSDTKCHDKHVDGGFWGPFFPNDGSFEFVPIPESKMVRVTKNKCYPKEYLRGTQGESTYGNAQGNRLKETIFRTISSHVDVSKQMMYKLKTVAIHNDPDFRRCTYGEGHSGRGQQCGKLRKNDFLVFCAALRDCRTGVRNQFVIGYYVIKEKHDFMKLKKEGNKTLCRKIVAEYWDKNAHFSKSFARAWGFSDGRKELRDWYLSQKEDDLILMIGKEGQSGLLKKAIQLTGYDGEKPFCMPRKLFKDLGVESQFFNRGFKWVYDESVDNLRDLLEDNNAIHEIA